MEIRLTFLIKYENYKMGEKYPEFRFQLQEYRDAMLLLAITRQKVWLKAESDCDGMEKYYNENKDEYIIGEVHEASNLEPEYKSMDEAHDVILADYQNYLMKIWIEELRSTYNVQINEEVLSSIN